MDSNESAMASTVRGLTDTAVEKLCALGKTDAQADIERLWAVVDDMITFWDLDPHLLDEFNKRVVIASQN